MELGLPGFGLPGHQHVQNFFHGELFDFEGQFHHKETCGFLPFKIVGSGR